MSAFATGQNPDYVRTAREVAGLRGQWSQLERDSGQKRKGDLQVATEKVPQAGMEYIRAYREVKYHETIFELLAKQYELAKMDEVRDAAVIQVLDAAIPPENKSGPGRLGMAVMGGLGSVLAVMLLAILRELPLLSAEQHTKLLLARRYLLGNDFAPLGSKVMLTEDKSRHPKLRIIPRLDIKGGNLVKGIHLEGLRVIGEPARFARHYYEEGADELLYIDIVASLYGRNSLLDIIERTASEVFIPLTVGGGLRSINDIGNALRAGADKIAINTAAVRRPEFIREAAQKFGSSTIVLSIEAMKRPDGSYEAYTDNGRERTGLDACTWAMHGVELGAGEVLVTSVDREGTGLGFDLELSRQIAEFVPVPVIASGGAANVEHVKAAAICAKVQAVAIASMLHYHFVRQINADDGHFSKVESRFQRTATISSKFQDIGLGTLKRELAANGILCRGVQQREAVLQ
jgi:cyclase